MTDRILQWMQSGHGCGRLQEVLLVTALCIALYLVFGVMWDWGMEQWQYLREPDGQKKSAPAGTDTDKAETA